MRKLTRRTSVVAAGLVATTGLGVAFAAWTSNGSGSGSAASTTSEDSVISALTLDVADELYPGATKATKVDITNPNDYPVVVTSISAGSSDAVSGCAADSVRTDARALNPAGLTQSDGSTVTIAPNSSASYTLTLRMTDDPSDACKSKTFTLPLTATVRSNADSQSF